MKYKRYIFSLLLIIVLGFNKVYAYDSAKCNYVDNLNDPHATAILEMNWNFNWTWIHNARGGLNAGFATAWFQNMGDTIGKNDREGVLNWYSDFNDYETGITLTRVYNDTTAANTNPTCPTYLIMRGKKKSRGGYSSFGAFATNNSQEAQSFASASNQLSDFDAWYLVHKNADGSEITDSQYLNAGKSIFNRKTKTDNYSLDLGGADSKIDCNELFGKKNDPQSISYLVNYVLKYPKFIVPFLVILYGTLDFGKAVIAGKEDEMTKAQKAFIKRVIIAVCVFLVPVILNAIMYLADLVWEGLGYTTCGL